MRAATPKQIALYTSLRRKAKLPAVSEDRLQECSAADLDALIKAHNEAIGFDVTRSKITPRQKAFLETLEREITGTVSHDIDRLTYAEADARIQDYRRYRAESSAPVVNIFTKKAV